NVTSSDSSSRPPHPHETAGTDSYRSIGSPGAPRLRLRREGAGPRRPTSAGSSSRDTARRPSRFPTPSIDPDGSPALWHVPAAPGRMGAERWRLSMQHKGLQLGQGFRVVLGNEPPQAAQMPLGTGETEGGRENRHRGADQWLYVVSGTGQAV